MNPTKPQFLIDTILIPKRTRLPSRKQAIKRTKSTRHRNPTQKSQKKPAHAPKPTPARKRKEQGLCRCGEAAIQGQTRCAECAVKHREWTRQDSENRRRAKGIKPRPQFDDAELIEQIQKEIADQETRGASRQPRECAAKRTRRRTNSIERKSVRNANHSASASNAPNQALKTRPAVLTAHSTTARLDCAAE